MKLTLRSLQSRKTQILDVPEHCSIRQLKEFLSPNSSSSSIRLSLDKKHELLSQFPGDSLLSAGVTSGDTIYYDLPPAQQGNDLYNSLDSDTNVAVFPGCDLSFEKDQNRAKGKEILIERKPLELEKSELYFLKRALCEEIGTDLSDNKLVFLVVHAVFLESGFVGFDPISRSRVDFFDVVKERYSMSFPLSFNYTFPELLSRDKATESIVVRFQILRHYVNVFGSLVSLERMHKLSIHSSVIVPAIRRFRATADIHGTEQVIFDFWKSVKGGLVLHLMIDLCEKTGLRLPCLICLPGDIKSRILKLLSGRDIARVACVCKEFKNLSANDELWKEKCMSEYCSEAIADDGNWKARFVSSWERLKRRDRVLKHKCVRSR